MATRRNRRAITREAGSAAAGVACMSRAILGLLLLSAP